VYSKRKIIKTNTEIEFLNEFIILLLRYVDKI